MKFILINDIQKKNLKIHMPQNDIVFQVSMSWVSNNVKFDLLFIYQNIWSYNLEFLNNLY